MAAPMCLARLRTFRRLLPLLQSHSYCKQVNQTGNKPVNPKKPKKTKNGRIIFDPKQNPYVAYVEGDPVQQAFYENTANKRHEVKPPRPATTSDEGKSQTKRGTTLKKKREPPTDILSHVNFDKIKVAKSTVEAQKEGKNKNGIFYKVIEREDDRRFIKPLMEVISRKGREKCQEILLEGRPLINDALRAGIEPVKLYFVHNGSLGGMSPEVLGDAEVYKVGRRHMRDWVSNDRSNNIAGIFKMPEPGTELNPERPTIPVTLICDYIRDGQSLGTLIHTAAAVGCEQVLVMKGCVDLWNPKTLQAGVGSHFCIPITPNVTWSSVFKHLPDSSKEIYAVGTDQNNEKNVLQNLDPMDIMEEIERVKEEELFGEDNIAEESLDSSEDTSGSGYDSDCEEDSDVEETERIPEVYKRVALNVQKYESVDYTSGHCVILVSGDPAGISLPARKLVHEEFGQAVEVPKSPGVARMNIAVTGSITLFEVAKQFRQKADKASLTLPS